MVDVGGAARQSVVVRPGAATAVVGLATADVELVVVAEGLGPVGPQGAAGRPIQVFVQATQPVTGVAPGDIWVKKPPVAAPQPTFLWSGAAWEPLYGEAGAPSAYEHVQSTTSARWTVFHLLHFDPQVRVVNTAGNTVRGAVTYVDRDNLTIDFSEKIAGTAYLS
jgi:hypothetical protein